MQKNNPIIKQIAVKLYAEALKKNKPIEIGPPSGVFLQSGQNLRTNQLNWGVDEDCELLIGEESCGCDPTSHMDFFGEMYLTTNEFLNIPVKITIEEMCNNPVVVKLLEEYL